MSAELLLIAMLSVIVGLSFLVVLRLDTILNVVVFMEGKGKSCIDDDKGEDDGSNDDNDDNDDEAAGDDKGNDGVDSVVPTPG